MKNANATPLLMEHDLPLPHQRWWPDGALLLAVLVLECADCAEKHIHLTLKLSTAAVRCAWLASPCTATAFHPCRLSACTSRTAAFAACVYRRAGGRIKTIAADVHEHTATASSHTCSTRAASFLYLCITECTLSESQPAVCYLVTSSI